jgi:hypothetical protein
MRVAVRLAACLVAAALSAARLGAQGMDGSRAGVALADRRAPETVADSADGLRSVSPSPSTHGIADIRVRRLAPVMSAIVPGSGQLTLGNDRFVVYTAVEVIGWWRFAKSSREQSQQESAFKTIARTVARSHFSTNPPDGDWTYYESMRDYLESGAYSLSNSGVVPETDVTTFNGHLWQQLLATNSTTAAALAAYESQAVKPNFQWSWRNAQLQYDEYIRTTDKRNDAYAAGVQDLILIGANHVLSMVDAFATFRLQVRPLPGGGVSLGGSKSW